MVCLSRETQHGSHLFQSILICRHNIVEYATDSKHLVLL